jgi:hypothetical protein
MKISQADRFLCESVEMRSRQDWIAGERKIAEALVVGHYDEDIRPRGSFGGVCRTEKKSSTENSYERANEHWLFSFRRRLSGLFRSVCGCTPIAGVGRLRVFAPTTTHRGSAL